jgi:hypothetical protein
VCSSDLSCRQGQIALGRISELGAEREITSEGNGREQVKIRFDAAHQIQTPELSQLLEDASRS